MDKFGVRVRKIREEKKLTREALCGDECELSVRQLARIEAGQSIPNLSKVSYIARQLGVAIAQLTDSKTYELTKRYQELKYLILRLPTYGDEDKIQLRETYFDEIYEDYYDELSEEEQLIIDSLQSKLDVYFSNNTNYGEELLKDYFTQILKRESYQVDDLVLIELFFSCFSQIEKEDDFYNLTHYDFLMERLLNQSYISVDNYFILNNVLLNNVDLCFKFNRIDFIKRTIQKSSEIMSEIQDFQKRPILNLVEWKYYLKIKKDVEKARESYEKSILFSELIGEHHLTNQLKKEWKSDCS